MSEGKVRRKFGLRDSEAALAQADWKRILDHAGRDDTLALSHHILNAYIVAAREEADAAAMERAAGVSLLPKWPLKQRFAISREFVAANRCDLAWGALMADPAVKDDPSFVKQAKRILAYVTDPALRKRIRDSIHSVTEGGLLFVPPRAELAFPVPDAEPTPLGTATATLGARTDERHLAAFDQAMAQIARTHRNPKEPVLREYRDVFVDRYGQIWREDGVTLLTTGKPMVRLDRSAVRTIPRAAYGMKDTRGIYHWLVDRVPFFPWMLDEPEPRTTILLSDRAASFERQTLDLAGLGDSVVAVGDAVFVEHLLRARVGFEGLMYWDRITPIFDRLRRHAVDMAATHGIAPAERLYISRSDARRRPLANEAEIEAALAADGYRIVLFGGMPLWQQIFLASSAREIVAPHGAGLSHLIVAERGTKVTEILPISDGTHKLRFNYARLSLVRGHHYRAWLEPQIGDDDSWTVDADAFLAFLKAD